MEEIINANEKCTYHIMEFVYCSLYCWEYPFCVTILIILCLLRIYIVSISMIVNAFYELAQVQGYTVLNTKCRQMNNANNNNKKQCIIK